MLVICFWFLLCFGCSFVIVGDTYVVYWFGGCCLFTSLLVRRLLVVVSLAQVYEFGDRGYSWACSCFLTGLVLDVFFCLLHLYRVGVLHQVVGAGFFLLLLLLFGCFMVFRPCTHEWTCSCVICPCLAKSRSVLL
jgi:hypothetical protein